MIRREALFWEGLDDRRVACGLCAHQCEIHDGQYGVCGARRNDGGTLVSASYGRVIAVHDDPIEKKPLFHFQPAQRSLSIATCGCNLRCDFCQNHSISQHRDHDAEGMLEGDEVPPERIVRQAVTAGCRSISYTYTEPTVFYEYCRDVGVRARETGLGNVFVTNGMISPAAVDDAAASFLDAANVDLKSFSPAFYRDVCKGSLEGVKRGLERMVERGVWVEVTTLVIPGRNDSDEELKWIAEFLAGASPDIPWHVSRFVPSYQVHDRPPTPLATLRRARDIGREAGLRFVYLGNYPGEGEDTICPSCGRVVIRRQGFQLIENNLTDGHCPGCGETIPGVWA